MTLRIHLLTILIAWTTISDGHYMAAIKLLNRLYVSQEAKAFTRVKTQKLMDDRMTGLIVSVLVEMYIFLFF